jgi:hypothetical protein
VVCILTGSKCVSPPHSKFVQWTAGAKVTDNNNYWKANADYETNAKGNERPASQTQSLRMTVTGNAIVRMFKNLAQSELNT